jgi:hypothetical protein
MRDKDMQKPLIAILFLLFSSTAWASAIEILTPGSFHSGEVKMSAQGQWWAVCDGRSSPQSLVPVMVTTKRVQDDLFDNGSEKTGIEVKVMGCEHVTFLVRGLSLKAKELGGGNIASRLVATYASKDYTFQVAEFGKSGYRFELSGAGLSQTIFKIPQVDKMITSNWRVDWVGDLDGDQKPDFLVQASDKDSVDIFRLLLSSRAKTGRLVEEVASFTTALGC